MLFKKLNNVSLALLVVFAVYQWTCPCMRRLYLGLVSFVVCFSLHKDLNSSIIMAVVVALSDDLYKQVVKSREGFEDKKEVLEKMLQENEYTTEKMINMKDTLKQNLGNIDKEALKNMTEEAKDFMEQQKELFSLIENLGPALKEGISLMNSFSNFSKDIAN